ncbi:MAG: DUF835 domain-containing protein [Theionarchaea archaeon]|jgi:hypothetical protein|nr:DUF835 domain-containing protein [Theionarchaea archaeon]
MISDLMVTTLLKRGFGLRPLNTQKKEHLEAGTAYIMKEDRPYESYKTFSELSKRKNSLIITRVHPSRLKKRFDFGSEILWLSTVETKCSIEPTQLSKMAFIISHFVKTNGGGAVLLDGIEYLILQNDFDSVLKFICSISDYVSLHNGILLLPLNPLALSRSQIKMLERELEPIT